MTQNYDRARVLRRSVLLAIVFFVFSSPVYSQDATPLPTPPVGEASPTAGEARPSSHAGEVRPTPFVDEISPTPLIGEISTFEPHSLLGKWNGRIRKFGRHPKLLIDGCAEGQVSGTYKGLFGKFPVSGKYDEQTGAITLFVDFSRSKLTRIKRLKSGTGIIEAKVTGGKLIGVASIQDFDDHQVRWEATKEQ